MKGIAGKMKISHGPNTGGVRLVGEPVVDEAIESAAVVTEGESMGMGRSRGVVMDMVGRGRG